MELEVTGHLLHDTPSAGTLTTSHPRRVQLYCSIKVRGLSAAGVLASISASSSGVRFDGLVR